MSPAPSPSLAAHPDPGWPSPADHTETGNNPDRNRPFPIGSSGSYTPLPAYDIPGIAVDKTSINRCCQHRNPPHPVENDCPSAPGSDAASECLPGTHPTLSAPLY